MYSLKLGKIYNIQIAQKRPANLYLTHKRKYDNMYISKEKKGNNNYDKRTDDGKYDSKIHFWE